MSELMYLYNHIETLLLIGARIIACFFILPIIEETKPPKVAIAGFSLAVAIPVYFTMEIPTLNEMSSMFGFTVLLIKEVAIGLILGFVVKLFFQVYSLMGTLLSMQGGLSMSTIMDPSSMSQSTLIGRIYTLGFSAIFLVSGGYHWLIQTLVNSFEVLPISQPLGTASFIMTIVGAVGTYFELGFKLALPILAVIFIIDVAMGIMARTVPQMNMFVVGIPLKMIVMFILMTLTISLFNTYNDRLIQTLVETMNAIIQEMRHL